MGKGSQPRPCNKKQYDSNFDKIKWKNECPLDGDEFRCEDCHYFPDYRYNNITKECESNIE